MNSMYRSLIIFVMIIFGSAAAQDETAISDRRSLESELTPVTGDELPTVDLYIEFEFDSATLTMRAERQLLELAAALNGDVLQGATFGIYGHTDASGSDVYNLELSKERAASVMTYLTGSGSVAADRLLVTGYGETRLKDPFRPNDSVNRRVEIVMLTPPAQTPDNDDSSITAVVE